MIGRQNECIDYNWTHYVRRGIGACRKRVEVPTSLVCVDDTATAHYSFNWYEREIYDLEVIV